jgi:carbohydrate-selective porin OprB
VYVSFDQETIDNIALFMRYGKQDEHVTLNDQFWSFGVQFTGAMWGRKDDYLGLATAMNVRNDKADFNRAHFNANERLYEIYYCYLVAKFLHIAPDLQILANPAGDRRAGTAVVAGLRLEFDF